MEEGGHLSSKNTCVMNMVYSLKASSDYLCYRILQSFCRHNCRNVEFAYSKFRKKSTKSRQKMMIELWETAIKSLLFVEQTSPLKFVWHGPESLLFDLEDALANTWEFEGWYILGWMIEQRARDPEDNRCRVQEGRAMSDIPGFHVKQWWATLSVG